MSRRRHLWVEYRQESQLIGVSLVLPAAESELTLLDLLFSRLHRAWLERQLCTSVLLKSPEFQIAKAIAKLLNSAPGLGLQMEWLKKDPQLFEELFLHAGEGRQPKLLELHQVEVEGSQGWEPGKELTISDLPFPTSGDSHADAIAVSLYQFNAPDAKTMHSWLDAETRLGVLRVLKELNRSPEDRINEFLKQVYEANQREYGDEFEKQFFEDW